jgi:RNA polymerase sigma factor (sigma-70 family)
MPNVQRGAVVHSIQRLFDQGTVVALDERQLLDRFVSRGDESAFEAIVGRHGPMVLSVCRRVLDNQHDVEDAFQATFLILVKKASSIRDRDMLGTWLHGVARRVAVRARANSRRRQPHERIGVESLEVRDNSKVPAESNEIRAVVDDELERLPYRYRAALLLCDMEGQTHEQAAVQMRCPVGTVKSRLSRGRERLRIRLARRGLATQMLLPGPMFATDRASAVPVKLLTQTIKAATRLVAKGAVTTGSITAGTTLLTEGAIRTMAITAPRIAAAALLATALAVGGVQLTVGLRPFQRAPVEQNLTAQLDVGQNSITESTNSRRAVKPGLDLFPAKQPPKRGDLRIARLKHDGDWKISDQAFPKLVDSLRELFDVTVTQKDLFARDPSLVYYPLIYIQGRGRFSLPKEDLAALRRHLEQGGSLFADANLCSPDFDASFRRLVLELQPTWSLVPIPKDDQLYSTRSGFDLSKVWFTKAGGGGRDFPLLEGVKINDYWAIIYSKYDISGALLGEDDIKTKGYTPESAMKIGCNIVIYSTLP